MRLFNRLPVTLSLIVINVLCFLVVRFSLNPEEPYWTLGLLSWGAHFTPFTFGEEWYRLLTSMFLHAGFFHLAVNMFGLFQAGGEIEQEVGWRKYLAVYFLSGIGAGFANSTFYLFTIGVGASGAIFGLFGFALMLNIERSRREGLSIVPIFSNFGIFLLINVIFSQQFNGDHAAHAGGLIVGIIVGGYTLLTRSSFQKIWIEFLLISIFISLYIYFPRYQVTYFNFFQSVIKNEEALGELRKGNHSDAAYVDFFKRQLNAWDSSYNLLTIHSFLPVELHEDTVKLSKYIRFRKAETNYRLQMVEKESYVYMDSIEIINRDLGDISLKYILNYSLPDEQEPDSVTTPKLVLNQATVYYDSDWVEVTEPPYVYYRIGTKDSTNKWQGRVTDFYADGTVQMKGTYKDDRKDGIFLYYSDHGTYTSAGRYVDNRSVGKWETYHDNGRLASEIYYGDRFFVKNVWSEDGDHLVVDGNGREYLKNKQGVIELEGDYKDGKKQGYWIGRYPDGRPKFEENYNKGALITGRSVDENGMIYNYDESSFFPIPVNGYDHYRKYLSEEVSKVFSSKSGSVKLMFRVTKNRALTDFLVEESPDPKLDSIAIAIVKRGPEWNPGKINGFQDEDSFTFVVIDFNNNKED